MILHAIFEAPGRDGPEPSPPFVSRDRTLEGGDVAPPGQVASVSALRSS
jgi:hypothetical protein